MYRYSRHNHTYFTIIDGQILYIDTTETAILILISNKKKLKGIKLKRKARKKYIESTV